MMKFYTYIPRKDGSEPKALINRAVFEAPSLDTAKYRAKKFYGNNAKLFFYMNFFNRDTFTEIL